ncbi:hypothetical protein ACSFA8_20835 [Variovorax sp. RT4R15]|uniref:hypothetical protein n=1 Tax=Variovorax sp. RT4R15 TaxID=3443737 RepID=UPI003F4635B4
MDPTNNRFYRESARPMPLSAPRAPTGVYVFGWDTDCDETIVCHLDYQPEEPAVHYGDAPYPGCDETITLVAAYVRDVDIYGILTREQIEHIEELALIEKHEDL